MRRRRFGPLELDVPVIGIGTWNMERDDKPAEIELDDATLASLDKTFPLAPWRGLPTA